VTHNELFQIYREGEKEERLSEVCLLPAVDSLTFITSFGG
jgi:hypothetical protein